MMNNKHEFDLSPMQNYTPPTYPNRNTLDRAKLRTAPRRWAKHAAVLACIGVLGFGALTGCAAPRTYPPASCEDGLHGVIAAYTQGGSHYLEARREFDVVVCAHWGGSGGGPIYVAYLTEQEALGIIRNRLCEAGICFDAPVPDYAAIAENSELEATARLALFDERTRQGIVFPATWWDDFIWWNMTHGQIEDALQQGFARRFNVSATFMQNPGESIGDYDWVWDWELDQEIATFTEDEKQEAGAILYERLNAQIDAFIAQLRTEGILPPAEEVQP
ncbi:MAG: hypothetical protein FWE08_02990 [Oscillospiraceae bacterium]|nr:hypothetical protein [Oscillospiraceae bacterium]